MTYIEQAVREAGEAGWESALSMNWYTTTAHEREQLRQARINAAFLDPAFWQALGKARGWIAPPSGQAYFYQHRFIDHRAAEKDAESFFAELLK